MEVMWVESASLSLQNVLVDNSLEYSIHLISIVFVFMIQIVEIFAGTDRQYFSTEESYY